MKRITISLVAIMTMGAFCMPALAQDEKERNKSKDKESKQEVEHIIITRKNVTDEKVVIEIKGDKITINGKDANEMKDGNVTVHRNKMHFNFGDGHPVLANSFLLNRGQNHAMLGVITEDAEHGVEITEVTKESAASKAGLKEGDVITKINDKTINSPDQLSETIRAQKPGEKVTVTYLRDKKEQKVSAELGKFKGAQLFSPRMEFPELRAFEEHHANPRINQRRGDPYGQNWQWSGSGPRLGLSVQDTDDGKGVKVIEVDEDSYAAKAGMKEGDIITHVNDKEVNAADEVARIVKENKDKVSIRLQLKRDGKSQNVEVKMPRKIKTIDM